jgi:hypothetical protein
VKKRRICNSRAAIRKRFKKAAREILGIDIDELLK